MNRRTIILGNGLIAKAIAKKLLAEGYTVRILSRSVDDKIAGAEYVQAELEEIVANKELFTRADHVIQTISTSSPSSSMDDICKDAYENVLLNVRLMDLVSKLDLKRFIFLSSGGSVYGKSEVSGRITEEHPTNPISAYGVAKLSVEKYLQLYGYHHGLNYLIIRPSNVYGFIRNLKKPQGVINHVLDCVLNKKTFKLWGSPDNRKDYLYVDDLAEAISLVLKRDDKLPATIYNLSYGETHSIGEIISIAEHITGRTMALEPVAGAKFDVNSIEVDGSMFRRDFNWQPQTNIEEGIAGIIRQYN